MHWAITEEDMSPRDATGVEGLIIRMEKELRADGTPIEGFRFLNSSAKMLRYSREIEKEVRASPTGACLYTGFQATDKLLAESRTYHRLLRAGVKVAAFGEGVMPETPDRLEDIWTPLERNTRALENQWFLVSSAPAPIAFIGWETSPETLFGKGGLTAPGKQFKGFVTNDVRVVHAVITHLESVSCRELQVSSRSSSARSKADHGRYPNGRRSRIRRGPLAGVLHRGNQRGRRGVVRDLPPPHTWSAPIPRKTGDNGSGHSESRSFAGWGVPRWPSNCALYVPWGPTQRRYCPPTTGSSIWRNGPSAKTWT